jgi:hypothetical protein
MAVSAVVGAIVVALIASRFDRPARSTERSELPRTAVPSVHPTPKVTTHVKADAARS